MIDDAGDSTDVCVHPKVLGRSHFARYLASVNLFDDFAKEWNLIHPHRHVRLATLRHRQRKILGRSHLAVHVPLPERFVDARRVTTGPVPPHQHATRVRCVLDEDDVHLAVAVFARRLAKTPRVLSHRVMRRMSKSPESRHVRRVRDQVANVVGHGRVGIEIHPVAVRRQQMPRFVPSTVSLREGPRARGHGEQRQRHDHHRGQRERSPMSREERSPARAIRPLGCYQERRLIGAVQGRARRRERHVETNRPYDSPLSRARRCRRRSSRCAVECVASRR